jgi:isopentenyldiphosphate isomerase
LKKFNVHIDYNGMSNNEIYYVFTCKYDGPIDNLKLQTEEVAEIKFMSVEKVKEEFTKNPDKFTPGKEYWFSILDKIKDLNSRK